MKKIITIMAVVGLMATGAVAGKKVINNYYNSTEVTDVTTIATALSAVELNPDHKGWSVGAGVGYDDITEDYSGAVGIGYGFAKENTNGLDVGLNVKAYDIEGGEYGVAAGVTVGF